MTRERFCEIQSRRGYEVENLGNITFLRHHKGGVEYTAMWFWLADGTLDKSHEPTWSIAHK